MALTLQWRRNERDGVSNHQRIDCSLNRLFRHRSKETSKLRVTGLCEGKPPVTGGFPSQRASNADNVSIWWRHHDLVNPIHACLYMFMVGCISPQDTVRKACFYKWDPEEENTPVDNLKQVAINIMEITLNEITFWSALYSLATLSAFIDIMYFKSRSAVACLAVNIEKNVSVYYHSCLNPWDRDELWSGLRKDKWNLFFPWKTMARVCYIVTTMTVDDLSTSGTKVSTTIVLNQFTHTLCTWRHFGDTSFIESKFISGAHRVQVN